MDEATEAQRAAVICALLGVVGTAIGALGIWSVSGTPLRVVQASAILINGTALLMLRGRRPPVARPLSNALFLLVLVPTVVMTWMLDATRAAHSARWVPYEPHKLSALALAMIAPPGWATGTAAIMMFIGSALVHHALLSDGLRARISAGEPFGIIAYGAFALVLLGFKQRSHAMHKELERERSEKIILERVARLAMALRDLANTPVQTLELVRQALLRSAPRLRVQADRMGRALERLHRLNDILLPYQTAVDWDDDAPVLQTELDASAPPKDGADSENAAPTPVPQARHRQA